MTIVNGERVAVAENKIRCRICESSAVSILGEVEFYVGYAWPIYDCVSCGCLSTLHENSAYEFMYSETSSCYNRYIGAADLCKSFFDRGDLAALREDLSKTSKYRFVIDVVEGQPSSARLLEIGASRGHLTSYFILAGRPIIGVDVSLTAVASANQAFGNHFVIAGDPAIEAGAPYDVIFHVGTIGCLKDPIGMTRDLLRLLKPGGQLLFNAPNREGLALKGQLWVEGAPPPDLVTMFPPGFWRKQFTDVADVTEEIESGAAMTNLLIGLRNLAHRRWKRPTPMPLKESVRVGQPVPTWSDALWWNFERIVRKVAPPLGLLRLAPRYPSEYGFFVTMTKKG